jgi:hypothetical protein
LTDFKAVLNSWEIFYSTVSLASVTLAGLLFVSLSIHQENVDDKPFRNMVSLARSSFGDFLYVLMLGLVFLVPHPVPGGLAIALFVLGLARAWGSRHLAGGFFKRPSRKRAFPGFLLSSIASIGLVIVGIEILRGVMVSIYGLVIVVAALLTNASWNAWLILVSGNRAQG